MIPRRYQLRKDALAIVGRGHPWIFREQLSSAAQVFADGQWLRLVAGDNRIVGYGIYEAEGAIAIRILRTGAERPDAAWLRTQLRTAIAKRAPLVAETNAIRLVHGESDNLPAVVVDRFADTIVVASYSAGSEALARYTARALTRADDELASINPHSHSGVLPAGGTPRPSIDPHSHSGVLPAGGTPRPSIDPHSHSGVLPAGGTPRPSIDPHSHSGVLPAGGTPRPSIIGPARRVVLRPPHRRRGQHVTHVQGSPPDIVEIAEAGLVFSVDLAEGHKTGTYLDLRGLRRSIAAAPLAGARVLNLFSYTGMLGRVAEVAGAAELVHVDISQRALAFAAEHHTQDRARHTFITADVFDWLPAQDPDASFDLVIVDPPAMTSRKTQIPVVLAAYRKLYRAAARLVRPGGAIVAACCTSRVEREIFVHLVREVLGPRFTLERDLPAELDHPVGFPQADYLKIGWWRATS